MACAAIDQTTELIKEESKTPRENRERQGHVLRELKSYQFALTQVNAA